MHEFVQMALFRPENKAASEQQKMEFIDTENRLAVTRSGGGMGQSGAWVKWVKAVNRTTFH